MSKIFIDDNILSINNTEITLKYSIKKIEKVRDKYIVLLKIPHVELGSEELNNILCYDKTGMMCWQISNELPSDIACTEQIPYVAIQVIEEKLYATDFWGRKFNVDIESGKLIDVKMVH